MLGVVKIVDRATLFAARLLYKPPTPAPFRLTFPPVRARRAAPVRPFSASLQGQARIGTV